MGYGYAMPRKQHRPTFIRQWREFRELSVESLGEAIEMSGATVSRIETGKQPYTQPVIERIADVLGVEVATLLTTAPARGSRALFDTLARATPDELAKLAVVAEALIPYRPSKN
jgi:transcriptional regulator with XRE-family HTH domain